MSVEGSSKAAIARVLGISRSTVSRWISRAALHARIFADHLIQDTAPIELQADELVGFTVRKPDKS